MEVLYKAKMCLLGIHPKMFILSSKLTKLINFGLLQSKKIMALYCVKLDIHTYSETMWKPLISLDVRVHNQIAEYLCLFVLLWFLIFFLCYFIVKCVKYVDVSNKLVHQKNIKTPFLKKVQSSISCSIEAQIIMSNN